MSAGLVSLFCSCHDKISSLNSVKWSGQYEFLDNIKSFGNFRSCFRWSIGFFKNKLWTESNQSNVKLNKLRQNQYIFQLFFKNMICKFANVFSKQISKPPITRYLTTTSWRILYNLPGNISMFSTELQTSSGMMFIVTFSDPLRSSGNWTFLSTAELLPWNCVLRNTSTLLSTPKSTTWTINHDIKI